MVDDAPENIEVLILLLHDTYRLQYAPNGARAVAIATSDDPPDLVLLDVMMPEMDGYEVIRQLKANEKTRDIPVIFLTSMSGGEDETRGFSLGAGDYIKKPFNPEIVKARVKTHLALALAHKRLARQNKELSNAALLKEDIERINRHDLKTPISSVIGLPEFLLKDANLTDDQRETLKTIRGAGYQMLNMVNSSLDMYKMEIGTYKARISPVNLVQLIWTITNELQELAESYAVSFTFSLDGAPLLPEMAFMVAGEETLLYSMFANLIKNAIEASSGGIVSVTLRKNGLAQVVVHNDSAIPENVRDKFFDKYVTSGKMFGTGLGTYSAKLIATTLRGDIQFETSEEKGTDIIVTLPFPESAPKPKERAQKVDVTNLAFLIADDMQNIRQIVKRTLQQMGVRKILMANDGRGAIKELEEHKIDCVISDWNMPHVSGLELLRWVRTESNCKDIPFLMVTAERSEEQVLAAAHSKVSGYIVKPFTPQMIRDKVESILNR